MKSLLFLVATLFLSASVFGQNKAEDLKKYFSDIQAAIKAGKTEEAAKLTTALIPDTARLKKALSDKVTDADLAKAEAMFASFPKDPALVGRLFTVPAERSEIQVQASTTEDLAKYAQGSVAFNEFPGG